VPFRFELINPPEFNKALREPHANVEIFARGGSEFSCVGLI
jgi:hypothetical protein